MVWGILLYSINSDYFFKILESFLRVLEELLPTQAQVTWVRLLDVIFVPVFLTITHAQVNIMALQAL
jgi:hypothetical protein